MKSRLFSSKVMVPLLCRIGAFLLLACIDSKANELMVTSFPVPTGMSLADISYIKPIEDVRAVIVLCPGLNGDGRNMIARKEWQEFASQERVGLMGIHFVSDFELLTKCEGYYQASKGSGEVLIKAVRKIYGKDLPVFVFGFSGGAHFATRFMAWAPERVAGWVALGAGVLDRPQQSRRYPPGLMACGENDPRLGGALTFFRQGRALQEKWLWLEISEAGHSVPERFEVFARKYFHYLLDAKPEDGGWVDVDQRRPTKESEEVGNLVSTGWLPSRELFAEWLLIGAQ